jgi:aspartate/methionine/tyrosine aminotransferase
VGYDNLAEEDVLCFLGASEAIYLAIQVLLDHDDHAVVGTPNYQTAETTPLSICDVTGGVALRPEDSGALDLGAVESALRPSTRLVPVNFPNNPTGEIADPETWHQLVQLREERDILLSSDEAYRGLELSSSTPRAQAADLSPTALSLNVMSKAYGLPACASAGSPAASTASWG